MRLNFWQWLGLILLIGAGSYWIYEQRTERAAQQNTTPGAAETVRPTTLPADATTAPAAP